MALDLWGSRIWLNVSIFYQFHKAKSRYLSSEPGHWFKKQLSKFSWNQSKDLTFAQIFAFCDLNVIFDNSNWIECVYILKFQIGVNSKAVFNEAPSLLHEISQCALEIKKSAKKMLETVYFFKRLLKFWYCLSIVVRYKYNSQNHNNWKNSIYYLLVK